MRCVHLSDVRLRQCGMLLGLLAITLRALPVAAAPLAYVTNKLSHTVSVLDTATNTVVATVPVGEFPEEVAITPNGAYAYVTNLDSDTVSVLDTATNTVVATVPVGGDPWLRGVGFL